MSQKYIDYPEHMLYESTCYDVQEIKPVQKTEPMVQFGPLKLRASTLSILVVKNSNVPTTY
jgi:hypothetical protein